jgi:hypothetical protein
MADSKEPGDGAGVTLQLKSTLITPSFGSSTRE